MNEEDKQTKPKPAGLRGRWAALSPAERKLLQRLGLCLVAGIVLMCAFGRDRGGRDIAPAVMEAPAEAGTAAAVDSPLEEELEQVLSQVKGAGRVTVAITYAGSSQSVYVYDTTHSQSSDGQALSGDTSATLSVVDDKPVLVSTLEPEIRGVVVVAEGAGDVLVRERLYQAVTGLLGIKADRLAIIEAEGGEGYVIP